MQVSLVEVDDDDNCESIENVAVKGFVYFLD